MGNIAAAFKAFFQALKGQPLIAKDELDAAQAAAESAKADLNSLKAELEELKNKPAPPSRFEEGAVYALLLLQREGRLIDFLQENLDGFSDDQIGMAVREIHKNTAAALNEHFGIKPVSTSAEGDSLIVPEPFDPTVYKLMGNVPDAPPFKGTLRHKGWQAGKVSLPERTGDYNADIVQPAEVEI